MITILHGDDIVASRNKLALLLESIKDGEVLHFEGEKTNVTDVIQAFETESLFGAKKYIVLEKFIATKDKDLVASLINHLKKEKQHDVVLWEPKEIKKELFTLFPKDVTVHFYKKQQMLFAFLDSIAPGNRTNMLRLFHEGLKTENEDLLLYMIVRQFRILLALSQDSSIDEVKRLAPWQRGKLEGQARRFTPEQLEILYKKLFQIEREIKTGANALPLPASLDLFLASI